MRPALARPRHVLGAALVAAGAAGHGAFAQSAPPKPEPLPVEAALSARTMGLYSAIRLSPDESRVAYTVCDPRRILPETDPRYRTHSRTGVWRFGLGCDVWITDTVGGESKDLTGGAGSSWAPNWSPDGKSLAYYSDRSGTASLWVWSRASGESRRVADAIVRPWGTSAMSWSPDGVVVVPLLPEGVTLEQAASLAVEAPPAPTPTESESGRPTVTVFEFRPADAGKPQKGAWSTDFLRADLAAVDLESGRIRRLVRGEKITGAWVSPDGSQLACAIDRGFAAAESQQQLYDLAVVPLRGGPVRTLAEKVPLAGLGVGAGWLPDSRSLAYLTTAGDVFVVAAGGGAPRKLPSPPESRFVDELVAPFFDARGEGLFVLAGGALWRIGVRDGKSAVFARIEGREPKVLVAGGRANSAILVTRREDTKDEGLYEVSLETGAVRKLWEGPKSIGRNPAFRVAAGPGSIVFASQDGGHDEDLWVLPLGGAAARRLTRINPAFDAYAMGESRLVEWMNADGKRLQGALLLPAGYVEGRRYPLVVFVYGGADLSDSVHSFGMRGGWGADDNFQLLATRGYAVFLPDAPSDWKDQMRDLPKNVLPGINRVIELGIADQDRLGIMGHSNGGYSTLALITLTPRFKAAVMRAGLGNMISFYGELGRDGSHYGLTVAESAFGMGNPWTARARYLENSPVLYLDRVETPLLIVHGSEDDAVAPFLAEEVFVGLRRLGKEVVYARYEGEGHQIENLANQLDYCGRMLAWFDEHLKAPAAAAAGAPP